VRAGTGAVSRRLFSTVAAIALGAAALAGCGGGASNSSTAAATLPTETTPAPALHGRAAAAAGAVKTLEQALRDGDVVALCRPGAVFTRAVISDMYGDGTKCQAALEGSGALTKPPTLTVTRIAPKRDLARAEVRVSNGATVPLDLVRNGSRWLVSFSEGTNPIVALEQ
jgi:hypothetical protein